MESTTVNASGSPARRWASLIIRLLVILFLIFDAVNKVRDIAPVREASARFGLPDGMSPKLGILLLACTAIYAFPRTAVLGAILLTGYLGGAIATHVRIGLAPWFPLMMGVLVWAGLWLVDGALSRLIPLRR